MKDNIKRLQQFFTDYTAADFSQLNTIYDKDATFQDPVHKVEGLQSLIDYFDAGREALSTCGFHFGDTLIAENRATLEWQMCFTHRRLNGGRQILIDGCSLLTYDTESGLVLMHRDYFDVGAMLYENVPLLGRVVRSLKNKLIQ